MSVGDKQGRRERPRFRSGFNTLRDLLSFLVGVGIIGHELLLHEQADPYLVGVGVALTGLPLVIGSTPPKGKGES